MIIIVTWDIFKSAKDNNPSRYIFYKTEKSYTSNDPSIPDEFRYFLTMTINNDNLECFIPKTDPAGASQSDFEVNYKSDATPMI